MLKRGLCLVGFYFVETVLSFVKSRGVWLWFACKRRYLQGVSHWSVFFNLALRERNIQVRLYLKVVLKFWDVDILIIRTNFQKYNLGWPPQPLRERVPKINKIVGFWWSNPHWETRIGIFGAMIDGNITLSIFFCEMRLLRSLRPLRLLRLLRSLRPQIF